MFEPENDLERSLLRAVSDPAQRPDFLLRMFNAETFVPLEIDGPRPPARPDGRVVLPPGAKLTFRTIRFGHLEYLPFFTAASRARAKNQTRSVLAPMATRELFERYAGRHFMLNPGYEHAQAFSADDVKRMLAGQFGKPVAPAAPAQPAAKPAFEINLPAVQKSTATPTSAALSAAVTSPLVIQPAAVKAPEPNAPEPDTLEPKAPGFKASGFDAGYELAGLEVPGFKAPEPASIERPVAAELVTSVPSAAAKPAVESNLPAVEKSTATPTSAALSAAVTSPLVIQPAAVKAPEPNAPELNALEPKASGYKAPGFEAGYELAGLEVPGLKAPEPASIEQPVAAELVTSVPSAAAKPAVESNPSPVQKPAVKTPEPKAAEALAPKQTAVPQPADAPWLIFNPQPAAAQSPPPSSMLPATQEYSFDDSFVFGPADARKPEAAKPAPAENLSKPLPAAPLDSPPATSPAEEEPASNPQVSIFPAASKPIELEPDAPKPSESEKTGTIKTAMFDALAVLKRLAANKQASRRPQQADAAFAKPTAPEALLADKPSASEIIAASQPVQSKPVQSKPAQPVASSAPEAPVKPVEASTPPAPEKAADMAPSQAPANRADTIPSDPQTHPASSSASDKPRMPSPPGVTIGKADPYPVDVLVALTVAVQDLPAIEAAYLAQVQFPERQPHYLVALKTSGDWEALVLALGFKLQKALPPNRRVEFTPLTGGMFDDYFRNETQPFFKKR